MLFVLGDVTGDSMVDANDLTILARHVAKIEIVEGSVVNMGLKNPDGSVCYVIGVTKAVRRAVGKRDGDMIHVTVEER